MIVVRLMGGLGNQMFQYAAAYSIAKKFEVELALDLSFLKNEKEKEGFTPRNYALDQWDIQTKELSEPEIREKLKHGKNAILKKLSLVKYLRYVNEDERPINAVLKEIKGNNILIGYFQNYEYFMSSENEIRSIFSQPKQISNDTKSILNKIDSGKKPVLAIHIRRGDYLKSKQANFHHGIMGADYYEKALKYYQDSKVEFEKIFIFTDDPENIEGVIKTEKNTEIIGPSGSRSPAEDIYLMAKCHHQIIANSSFSWWGAYLNSNKRKVIVAPQKWHNNEDTMLTTKRPPSWILL